jgi:hypothetical protein
MVVSRHLHAPAALLPWKESLLTIGEEAGWALVWVWTRWWREISHLPPGIEPPIVKPVAQRHTSELSRLYSIMK